MNEITLAQPSVSFIKASCAYDFTQMDSDIESIEKRIGGLVSTDKKETKAICAELNKLKKAVNDEGIRIEKEATAEVKEFRKELKKRTDRIDAVRAPLWEQVKPAPKVEPKKEVIKATKLFMFTGDIEYIMEMVKTMEFAGVEVKEVQM